MSVKVVDGDFVNCIVFDNVLIEFGDLVGYFNDMVVVLEYWEI